MKKTIESSVKLALLGSSLVFGSMAHAAAAWVDGDSVVEPGKTIQAISANDNKMGYTGNPALVHRAWGMHGSWLAFELKEAADVQISLSSKNTNAPGFTVYATDGPFTWSQGAEGNKDGIEGARHAFNQVAQAGDPGLVWATDDSVSDSIAGNTAENGILQTLGYVNGSSKSFVNYWGYQVVSGAHDLSINNAYESGVFGSVDHDAGPNGDMNYANLNLVNLQPGDYTIFLSGTNPDGVNTPIDVKVSAVALSTADCLMNNEEQQNPETYPHAGLVSQTLAMDGKGYYYREYTNGNLLGVSSEPSAEDSNVIVNHLYSVQDGVMNDLGDIAGLKDGTNCQ